MARNAYRLAFVGGLLGALALASAAQASHFRGAAMVPSISSTGLLTVTSTSFWRPTAVGSLAPTVTGVGSMGQTSIVTDTSDSRFTRVVQTHTRQLTVGATYSIVASSCCRVAGIINASESTFTMDAAIVWDGSTANTPIQFNFSAIQPEVIRGQNYSDNLGATAGPGLTLSYNQALNTTINSQPPGLTINTTTGELSIPGASTATYLDNPTGNVGADYAFSGNIIASDGSFVEFDWLFDAVNQGTQNLAPDVGDIVINALVGDLVNTVITATDPNTGDTLTLTMLNFLGPGAFQSPGFVPTSGNPATGAFSWDTAGSTPGTYQALIQASDGSITDTGTITINLSLPVTTPEPEVLALFGLGLAAAGWLGRRRRAA